MNLQGSMAGVFWEELGGSGLLKNQARLWKSHSWLWKIPPGSWVRLGFLLGLGY
jgi:hypothetical protein